MAKILDVGSGWFGGVFANPAENEAAETRNDNIPSICKYVILYLWCSPGHEPSILSQSFCIVFLINHSSVSPGPCQGSVSASHVSTVITGTRKNLPQNPTLLNAGDPTMMWRMDHSGLYDHTTATALLYMRPLLLRAGE